MYQLGNTTFEGLLGFESLSIREGAEYAEHAMLGAKPQQQRTGDALDTLEVSVRLNSQYCKPEEELDSLREARRVGYILPLSSGDGRYYGDWLITALGYTVEKLGPDGGMWAVLVTLSLREYFYTDRAAAARRKAKAQAFALPGNARPFAQIPTPTRSREVGLVQRVLAISGTVLTVGSNLRKAATDSGRRGYLLREVTRGATGVLAQVAAASGWLADNPTAEGAAGIASALGSGNNVSSFATATARLTATVAAGDFDNARAAVGTLQTLTQNLRVAAIPTATAVGTGKTLTGGI